MMLACWVLPPKYLVAKKREKMLIVLDTLGKWSLIDAYMLIMMTVSFRYSLDKNILKSNFL